jgi:hypothetical protein
MYPRRNFVSKRVVFLPNIATLLARSKFRSRRGNIVGERAFLRAGEAKTRREKCRLFLISLYGSDTYAFLLMDTVSMQKTGVRSVRSGYRPTRSRRAGEIFDWLK